MLHAVEFSLRLGFNKNMSTLNAFGSRCIRWCTEVKVHGLITTYQTSEPRSPIKAYRNFTRFFQMCFDTPLIEFTDHPFGCIFIAVRSYQASAKTIGQNIQMFHCLIVSLGCFNNFLYSRRLCINYISAE